MLRCQCPCTPPLLHLQHGHAWRLRRQGRRHGNELIEKAATAMAIVAKTIGVLRPFALIATVLFWPTVGAARSLEVGKRVDIASSASFMALVAGFAGLAMASYSARMATEQPSPHGLTLALNVELFTLFR